MAILYIIFSHKSIVYAKLRDILPALAHLLYYVLAYLAHKHAFVPAEKVVKE